MDKKSQSDTVTTLAKIEYPRMIGDFCLFDWGLFDTVSRIALAYVDIGKVQGDETKRILQKRFSKRD